MSFIDPNDFLSAESGKDSLDSGQDSPQDSNLQQGGYLDNTNLTDSQPQDANPAISDPIKETYSMDNLGTNPYVPVDYLHGADETKDDGMDLIDRGIAYHAQELLNDPDRSSGLLIGVLKDQANLMGNPYVQNLLDRHEAIGHFNTLGEANPWKDYLVQTPDAMTLGHGMPQPDPALPGQQQLPRQQDLQSEQIIYTSQAGIDQIKRSEGFSSMPYPDTSGNMTIGYGHKLQRQQADEYRNGISQQDAEILLQQDIKNAESKVRNDIHVPMTQGQFDAAVDYTFNIGHLGPKYQNYMNSGDYDRAGYELDGNSTLKGAQDRRATERNMHWNGVYTPPKQGY